MSQVALLQQLRQTDNPDAAQQIALELLGSSRRREMVDAALRALEKAALDDKVRPVLRQKAWHYFEHDDQDNGALIREKLIRLLMSLAHPEDRDLYLRGLNTYEVEPMMGEVTQNLRAVSLLGLAQHEPDLAHLYATKLLNEIDSMSKFSGEPAMTAISLLSQHDKILPIYAFLLSVGIDAAQLGDHEVVGQALESLGPNFPAALYAELCKVCIPLDRAVISMGVATYIVEQRAEALYPWLDEIIGKTRHDELHRYCVLLLAGTRDTALNAILFALAKRSPPRHIANFIEALELVPGEAKDALIESLRGRKA